jgi:predicted secreted protein
VADTDRMTGKAMYLTIAGTDIPIVKADPGVSPKYGDTTDSDDYDVATDLLYPTQIQVSAPVEIAVEGRFRATKYAAIVSPMFNGGGPYAVTFGPKTGLAQFTGNYDINDYKQSTPHDDTVTWTATLKSNGKITP